MSILALDPGLTKPGVAFHTGSELFRADRLKVPKDWSKLGILDRCDHVAEAACEWFAQFESKIIQPLTLIVEWPQWYGIEGSDDRSIDPNDLAGLCGISGSVIGRLRAGLGWELAASSLKPREVWGTLPKVTTGNPWHSPRGARLYSRLTAAERERVAKYHDALDAAGLALFAAGLWKARHNYPGAV